MQGNELYFFYLIMALSRQKQPIAETNPVIPQATNNKSSVKRKVVVSQEKEVTQESQIGAWSYVNNEEEEKEEEVVVVQEEEEEEEEEEDKEECITSKEYHDQQQEEYQYYYQGDKESTKAKKARYSHETQAQPPPPPPPPGLPQNNEALSNLIMSWYYAGYYTGLYQVG